MIMHQYAEDGIHVAAAPEICAAFYYFIFFILYIASSQGQGTTTACPNYCVPILPRYVDFGERKNRSTRRKTLKSTGQINYGNSTQNTTPDLFPVSCHLGRVFGLTIFNGPQVFYVVCVVLYIM